MRNNLIDFLSFLPKETRLSLWDELYRQEDERQNREIYEGLIKRKYIDTALSARLDVSLQTINSYRNHESAPKGDALLSIIQDLPQGVIVRIISPELGKIIATLFGLAKHVEGSDITLDELGYITPYKSTTANPKRWCPECGGQYWIADDGEELQRYEGFLYGTILLDKKSRDAIKPLKEMAADERGEILFEKYKTFVSNYVGASQAAQISEFFEWLHQDNTMLAVFNSLFELHAVGGKPLSLFDHFIENSYQTYVERLLQTADGSTKLLKDQIVRLRAEKDELKKENELLRKMSKSQSQPELYRSEE